MRGGREGEGERERVSERERERWRESDRERERERERFMLIFALLLVVVEQESCWHTGSTSELVSRRWPFSIVMLWLDQKKVIIIYICSIK